MTVSAAWAMAVVPISGIILCAALLLARISYNLYFSPLSKFRGPWYAVASSLSNATISLLHIEPQWLLSIVKRYGGEQWISLLLQWSRMYSFKTPVDDPIRVAPNLLLLPKPSSLREIYWESSLNQKSGHYGTGVLGPPNLFGTIESGTHKALRKALGGPAVR